MKKLEKDLDRFMAVLEPLTKKMTYGQKRYAESIFSDILIDVSLIENEMYKAKSDKFGMTKDEYSDSLMKALHLLEALGFTSVDFNLIDKKYIDWIVDQHKAMLKEFNHKSFIATWKWLKHFEIFNERLPESIDELKKYITDVTSDN